MLLFHHAILTEKFYLSDRLNYLVYSLMSLFPPLKTSTTSDSHQSSVTSLALQRLFII